MHREFREENERLEVRDCWTKSSEGSLEVEERCDGINDVPRELGSLQIGL
jgi:hypothetical protein